MTVAELKAKVYTEFEIPTNVQRWIIGKNLADRDDTNLEELQAVDGSPIFLYLVAPGKLFDVRGRRKIKGKEEEKLEEQKEEEKKEGMIVMK